jgi:hypothetical protein
MGQNNNSLESKLRKRLYEILGGIIIIFSITILLPVGIVFGLFNFTIILWSFVAFWILLLTGGFYVYTKNKSWLTDLAVGFSYAGILALITTLTIRTLTTDPYTFKNILTQGIILATILQALAEIFLLIHWLRNLNK